MPVNIIFLPFFAGPAGWHQATVPTDTSGLTASFIPMAKDGRHRSDIRPGIVVNIVQKKDQPTGKRTRGEVAEILTSSAHHPHGIKVRLKNGQVGRVQEIIE